MSTTTTPQRNLASPSGRARSGTSSPKRKAKATPFTFMPSSGKAKTALLVHQKRQEAMRHKAPKQDPQPRVQPPPAQVDATSKSSPGQDHQRPCPQSSSQADDELARQLAAVAAAVDAIGRRLATRGHAGMTAPRLEQQQSIEDRTPQTTVRAVLKDNFGVRHLSNQRQDHVVATSDAVDRQEDEDDEDANAPWPVPRVLWVETAQESTPATAAPPPAFWWE
ncbi:hypothetical protein pqer_cds_87 [Pandoravirus quercus]|uniref:Uncharacterized protein n=2 Tax=Pandoravirus TaxID=2060084 RepID=A0A2U7U7W3_9VIRU|nr:hypothetical protein pqer_cds_87 [Pandoravirus quercus]AVK74509.1 hypothetical protein pqer_cds_87 [Pandoravirus quercus]QBZ80681.1 hypothetical protein pclt_cds_83 [Pandoravirus celtis]